MGTISDERLAELMQWVGFKLQDIDHVREEDREKFDDVLTALGELMDRRETTHG
jgi:hypothetical protein